MYLFYNLIKEKGISRTYSHTNQWHKNTLINKVVYRRHYLVVTWLVPCETAAVSVHYLCTSYNCAPVYSVTFTESQICKVYVCSAVTCHLQFWQTDRDFVCAIAVTRGWNGYQNIET